MDPKCQSQEIRIVHFTDLTPEVRSLATHMSNLSWSISRLNSRFLKIVAFPLISTFSAIHEEKNYEIQNQHSKLIICLCIL